MFAEALSEAAILEAIRQGHLYLSADGCTLNLTAQVWQGETTTTGMMGDTMHGQRAQLTVTWDDPESGDVLRLISDGQLAETILLEKAGTWQWAFPIERSRWHVIEWRDSTGRIRAITNPIFFERSIL